MGWQQEELDSLEQPRLLQEPELDSLERPQIFEESALVLHQEN